MNGVLIYVHVGRPSEQLVSGLLVFVSDNEYARHVRRPWPFEWGYWYAWTSVVLFQALVFGLNVPLVCPL